MKKISFLLIILCISIIVARSADALVSTSQMGYHPLQDKRAIAYTVATSGTYQIINSATGIAVFNGELKKEKDFYGTNVNCQGNNPCIVGDFSSFVQEGNFFVRTLISGVSSDSSSFTISKDIFKNNIKVFDEFFEALEQQNSDYHADYHKAMGPLFSAMSDGSFIMEADQAALPLIRLGSAYRKNPSIFSLGMKTHILTLSDYLSNLQGLKMADDINGMRLSPAVKVNNAFVPGPTTRTTIKVYTPGSSPSLMAEVSVKSLCGSDDGSTNWDNCIGKAANYYKCQIDEPCLNITYIEKRGKIVSKDNGYEVSKGWGYEFGCFVDNDFQNGIFNEKPNPCMIFYPQADRTYTMMTLLGFLEAYPVAKDISSLKGETLLKRSVDTYNFIKANPQILDAEDSAFYGASLFLLYDYTKESKYLNEAYAQRSKVSQVFISDHTRGNEFYWEEYIRHKDAIVSSGLGYTVNNIDPIEFFRGKMYNDFKDRGSMSISSNSERVFLFDNNIQFQNSRYMLTEGMLAAKASNLGSTEPFIRQIADSQLSWLTGMNAVQKGVFIGSPLESYSFILGIGSNFPKQFHSRYLVNSGYKSSSGNEFIGFRSSDLQWNDGAKYVYFDGVSSILGQKLGAIGNEYNGEQKLNIYNTNIVFKNSKKYIPGWINGAFDVNYDSGSIFNYDDNVNTYEFTETTNEIVATAVELFSYMDSIYNHGVPPVIVPTNDTTGTGSMYSVKDVAASCIGGTIKSDTFDGGRHITCSDSNGNSLKIDAWDKPSASNAQYFEMYKVSKTGTGIKICLSTACINGNGYVRSQNYPMPSTNGDTSPDEPGVYHNLKNMPASCTGGIVTSDIYDGGRKITCSSGGNSLSIVAWDKPGTENAQYFEMYKISGSGTGIKICLAAVCINGNGYAKSSSYPITFAIGEVVNPPQDDTMYHEVRYIAANCIGGTIKSDTFDGGRHITCSDSNGNSLKIDAWDKPSASNPEYFEMYKVSKTGTGIKICLSTACINGNGYAKSPDFPISKSAVYEEETETGSDLAAVISVAEWYPKDAGDGMEYIFECKGTGGSGDYLYDYDFGNGYKTFLTTWNRQYQKYPYGNQGYVVTCTVKDQVKKFSKTASMTINPD